MPKLVYLLVLVGLLAGCSAPVKSPSGVYPENPAVSNRQGMPHDSATSYFPADASVNASKDSLIQRLGDCQPGFRSASKNLFAFKVPVLSNYYLGHTIYRFLWLRSFARPVLLTLEVSEAGGVLRTQFLSKDLLFKSPSLAEEKQTLKHIAVAESLAWTAKAGMLKSVLLEGAKNGREALRLTKLPLVMTTGKPVVLSKVQVQQFRELLTQAGFWQLPNCAPIYLTDGDDWLLEAHEPNRYKAVVRQSPRKEQAQFRGCCEFLLNLSGAKPEPRQP